MLALRGTNLGGNRLGCRPNRLRMDVSGGLRLVWSMKTFRALAANTLALSLLWGCGGKGESEPVVAEAEAVVENEEERRAVEATFDGRFEHTIELHDERTHTVFELGENSLLQRKNDLVVFEAKCERQALTRRRVTFSCVQESGRVTQWPFELDEGGDLFHRAQPELRFARIAHGE